MDSPENTFASYAFISIGANLPSTAGTPAETIAWALNFIAGLSDEEILKSSVYSSSPVESPAGTPDFLNAMAAIIPQETETPLTLLHKLQAIENNAGRTRSGIVNEARVLDLDIVFFRSEIVNTPELVIPHPRAYERRFVLEPLIELVKDDFIFPGMTMNLADLLENIAEDQLIYKI